ncbi:AMP-binding protein [Falsiroseomonas stagni]|uniref:Fatty-acyl-CoA synthase n=1 Tax=Falsiroseomonas stagni DSM 19981 TaxID=1123062 RepID=A0A1I3XBE6_9PROT|nr:AMP-binding protein [Falsiroseomonas stagni]SFK16898.1 fatty-acyl-CoA synthase [Falsiroseomonas stagni DSM 19981]
MVHGWAASHPPDRVALRFGDAALTYAALDAAVGAMAGALAVRGIGRGDRIGFLGHNHPAQIVALLACARIGAMQVPLNWRLAAPEWRFILEDAGASLLLATPDFLQAAADAAPAGCVVVDAATLHGDATPAALGTDDDPLLLVYTSGTTGRPKGAVLDQRALRFNALNAAATFDLSADDRVLTVLPLFHVGGLNIQTTPALMAGAEVILHPRFDADAFFDTVERDRPTLTLLVPAVMQALVSHPRWEGADLSSLRAIGAGSSDVPLPLIEAFHQRGIPVQQVYGATETCPIAIVQTRDEALAAPGSIGRPALHAECRLVDASGAPCAPGTDGEIQVRGPAVLRGYWKRDDALTADGWFPTGDVGLVDNQGRWWFTDRLKHVIISGGENIYPAEVERLLRSAPGVAEGAVVGRDDPRWGEVPIAVVVPGEGFDPARVLAHFEGQIARFKQPRAVVALPALPRTALGKVEVARLREMVAAHPNR